MTSVTTEIQKVLKACKCSKWEQYLQDVQTKDELYRLSLKDLLQKLPTGHGGKSAASKIHNQLVMQRQADEAKETDNNAAAARKGKSGGSRGGREKKTVAVETTTSRGGGRPQKGQSKYKSSPHIEVKGDGYGCKYCKKTFAASNQAVIHARTHTGERPYNCLHCDKTFTQISSRNLHSRTKHPDQN